MVEVIGLIANKIIQPKINDIKANIKKILKFEYPKTFIVSKSVEFLKFKRNHILEIKIIKGINFITILGTYNAVREIGIKIEEFEFLKNSISSNKFNISPKQ
tara:strand:+ start:3807 stop:4112 length:306 start_codon:yes stop_codon:yes gene_type:complete